MEGAGDGEAYSWPVSGSGKEDELLSSDQPSQKSHVDIEIRFLKGVIGICTEMETNSLVSALSIMRKALNFLFCFVLATDCLGQKCC